MTHKCLKSDPLYCREHLGEKADHQTLISHFEATQPKGEGLKTYLQHSASYNEANGNHRTYLIRNMRTNELVGYYTIRAGNVLTKNGEWTTAVSGIELTNFAVNGAYRRNHPELSAVGKRIFFDFIMPQAREIHEILGTGILFIYALDEKPLEKYYENLGFEKLPDEEEEYIHANCKPSYDAPCNFMYMLL